MSICEAITKKGEQCKLKSLPGTHYCNIHIRETEYFEKNVEELVNLKSSFYSFLTNTIFQIILTALVFGIIFFLFGNDRFVGSYFSIPTDTAKNFFLIISQILSTIIGFYMAVIILSVQLFGSERSKAIDLVQGKVEKVSELILNLPQELSILHDDYYEMLDDLDDEIKNMMDNKKVVSFEKINNRLIKMLTTITTHNLPKEYITHINSYLWNIDRILSKSIIPHIGSIAIKNSNKILIKLIILLGLSLLLFTIFGIVDLKSFFSNLNAPILFSFIFYTFLILIEFINIVFYLFENLREWK